MSSPSSVVPDQGLAAPRGDNPYVGPRSIKTGERIYGRKREIAEVRDRLIADRIVLMYSPSGAGKTSLINAGLRPELESRGFVVLPTIRINHRDDELGRADGYNRYRLSLMQSLEEGRADDQRIAPAALSAMSLAEYFTQIAARHGELGDLCLVFDQFEELLTLDSADLSAKDAFMEELGLVLRDRRWWVLFSMREDFVAPLDPYLDFMPTRLSSHYRLELLSAEAATVAARAAAAQSGVHFEAAAANQLINDLRLVRVQRGEAIIETPGAYVEPVQLQVVCSQLWTRLSPAARTIELADVESLGNVDDALAEYYEQRVGAAAAESGVSERELRQWIEEALITEQGFRTQSLAWTRQGGGAALASLENSHLVRTETHRGARWFELAHDRLVDPIRTANEAWRSSNLSLLQVRSGEWYQHGKPTGLLIGGKVLAEAEVWAAEHPEELNDIDREYLAKSRVMEESARRLRRSSRRNLVLAVLAMIAFGVALRFCGDARQSEERAKTAAVDARLSARAARVSEFDATFAAVQARVNEEIAESLRRVAQANELAARSRALQLENPALALAVAAESTEIAGMDRSPPATFAAIAGARSVFSQATWQTGSGEIDQPGASHVAVDPSGTEFASAGCAEQAALPCAPGTIYLSSLGSPIAERRSLGTHGTEILALDYGADGVLTSSSADRTVRNWDTITGSFTEYSTPNGDIVNAVGAHPTDPNLLVTGDQGGHVIVWDRSGDQPVPRTFQRDGIVQPEAINDVTFRFDGKLIASAESNGDVVLWDVSTGRSIRRLSYFREEGEPARAALSIAFFPDEQPLPCPEDLYLPGCVDMLVVGHEGGMLWRWANPNSPFPENPFEGDPAISPPLAVQMEGHTEDITSLSFDESGSGVLASASADRTIRLWKFEKLSEGDDAGSRLVTPVDEPLAEHSDTVNDVAFSPDGTRLVSSSGDNTVRLWGAPTEEGSGVMRLGDTADGSSIPSCYDDDACASTAVAFDGDGLLASTATDGYVRFWDPRTGKLEPELLAVKASGPLYSLSFHPTGDTLLIGGRGVVWEWSRARPAELTELWTDDRLEQLTNGELEPNDVPAVRMIAFDATGELVAFSDDSGRIQLAPWTTDVDRSDERNDVQLPECSKGSADAPASAVSSLTFHEDSLILGDTTGCLWRVTVGENGTASPPTGISNKQTGEILDVDVDRNGYVATAGRDQTVYVSHLDRPEQQGQFRGHKGEVTSVAFNGDRYLASASEDGTIRLWWLTPVPSRVDRVPTLGEPVSAARGCRTFDPCVVSSLAFSGDSFLMAAARSDGLVQVWDGLVDPSEACRLAAPFVTVEQVDKELGAASRVCFR